MVRRRRDILDLARGECCQWCGRQDDTVVAAHANQLKYGKGLGLKAYDEAIAFLCSVCHAELDQGRWLSKEQRRLLWDTAHHRTLKILRHKVEDLDTQHLGSRQADPEGPTEIRQWPDVHTEEDEGLRSKGE